LLRYLRSLGLRLGRHADLIEMLRLEEQESLSFEEQLLWAEIVLQLGEAEEGLRILRAAAERASPVQVPQVISVPKTKGMRQEALRLACELRERTVPGGSGWRLLTREIVSLTCQEGETSDCLREGFGLVNADSASRSWVMDVIGSRAELDPAWVIAALNGVTLSRRALALAAEILVGAGQSDEGLILLAKHSIVRAPDFVRFAGACAGRGDRDVASEAYREALIRSSCRPETLSALVGLMETRADIGTLVEAASYAHQIVALQPDRARDARARLVLARFALVEGDLEDAVEHARQAANSAVGQQKAVAMWLEAEALLASGEVVAAAALCNDVAERWPSDNVANDCLVMVTVLSDSCSGAASFGRAVALRWRRSYLEAASSFADAARMCNGSALACEALLQASRCFVLAGETERALALLDAADEQPACGAKQLLAVASVLETEGRTEEAVQRLEQLLLDYPDSPTVVPARRELKRMRGRVDG
jgi:tetratricopeptide (TPR) repeat protein